MVNIGLPLILGWPRHLGKTIAPILHAQALLVCQLKDIKNTFELTFLSKNM